MTKGSIVIVLALVSVLPACSAASSSTTRSVDQPAPVVQGSVGSSLPTPAILPTVVARAGDLPTNVFETPTYTTPAPPVTRAPDPPPPVIPSDILFDTGSSVLKPQAEPYLAGLSQQIEARYPGAYLKIVGYTDSRGDAQYNLSLSARRAQAVLEVFASNGYPTQQMTALGRGEQQPLMDDTDANGNFLSSAGAKNRRVEIGISP